MNEEKALLLKDEEKRMIFYIVTGMVLMWAAGYLWAVIT